MDESQTLSWQASLAKKNINILNIDHDTQTWFYEFMYHPRPGQTKWCKTFFCNPIKQKIDNNGHRVTVFTFGTASEIAAEIMKEVLELRKELEG